MAFEQGYALVIGVGSYPQLGPRWQAAITAADAQALAAELVNPATAGYPKEQVTLLHDAEATKAGILAAFDTLATQAGDTATVLVFYSGHGHYGSDGVYYLTTHDSQMATVQGALQERLRPGSGISQGELLAKVGALKAKKVLLIFNACHAGELMPTLGADEAPPALGEPLPPETNAALLGSGEGRAIISACRPRQFSFIGGGAQTIFAQALLDGLRGEGVANRGGLISVYDLYGYLYEAVGDEVRRQIPAALLTQYGGQQEPELTILRQVGAFPVARYQGSPALGSFPEQQPAPADTAVREVNPSAARSLYRQLVTYTSIGGDQNTINNSPGTNVNNSGTITQTFGDTVSGTKTGNVKIEQQGGVNMGVGNRIGRIGNIVGGDVVHGDKVGGDKIGGDKITVGTITGGNVALGRGSIASSTSGLGGADLAQIFAQVYRRIDARQETPDATNDDLRGEVKKIEEEAKKGDQANENRLLRAFSNLAALADDIFEVTVAALTSPLSAATTVVKKIAARAKADKKS